MKYVGKNAFFLRLCSWSTMHDPNWVLGYWNLRIWLEKSWFFCISIFGIDWDCWNSILGVSFFIFVLNEFEEKISSFCAFLLLLLNWVRGKNLSFFLIFMFVFSRWVSRNRDLGQNLYVGFLFPNSYLISFCWSCREIACIGDYEGNPFVDLGKVLIFIFFSSSLS